MYSPRIHSDQDNSALMEGPLCVCRHAICCLLWRCVCIQLTLHHAARDVQVVGATNNNVIISTYKSDIQLASMIIYKPCNRAIEQFDSHKNSDITRLQGCEERNVKHADYIFYLLLLHFSRY